MEVLLSPQMRKVRLAKLRGLSVVSQPESGSALNEVSLAVLGSIPRTLPLACQTSRTALLQALVPQRVSLSVALASTLKGVSTTANRLPPFPMGLGWWGQ